MRDMKTNYKKTSRDLLQPLSLVGMLACSLLIGCSDSTSFKGRSSGSPADPPLNTPSESIPESTVQSETDAKSGLPQSDDVIAQQDDKAAEAQKLEPNDLIDACQTLELKSIASSLSFPERKDCRFGDAGNLEPKNGYLQAIESQTETITLPSRTAVICGLNVTSASEELHYDDFIFLTLDEHILLASNTKILEELPQDEAGFRWDFSKVRGVEVDFDSPAYCLGETDSLCNLPVTDTVGQMELAFYPETLAFVAKNFVGRDSVDISLIATGDDNDEDCFHSDFSMSYVLQYVEIPE